MAILIFSEGLESHVDLDLSIVDKFLLFRSQPVELSLLLEAFEHSN